MGCLELICSRASISLSRVSDSLQPLHPSLIPALSIKKFPEPQCPWKATLTPPFSPSLQVPPQRMPSCRSQLASSHSHRRPELCPLQVQRPHWHCPLPLHRGPVPLGARHPDSRSGEDSSASEHSQSRPRRPGTQLGGGGRRGKGAIREFDHVLTCLSPNPLNLRSQDSWREQQLRGVWTVTEYREIEEQGEFQQREEASGGENQGGVLGGLRKRKLETVAGGGMEDRVRGVWGSPAVKGSRPSPAHPTLEVALAITAVRSLQLGVAAVAATQCVQLHSQLLGEATGSEPQQTRLWEAAGSFEGN